MRIYHDVIDVRRGLVAGQEAPEQFLWRGKLWVVRDVLAHWVETGAWWEQADVAALLGVGVSSTAGRSGRRGADLLGERDVWRVEAGRGRVPLGFGVFDLSFGWSDARWRLVSCAD